MQSRTKKVNGYTSMSKEGKTAYHTSKGQELKLRNKQSKIRAKESNVVHLTAWELMMGVFESA